MSSPFPGPFPAPGGREEQTIPTGILSGAFTAPPFPSHFHSHSRWMEDGISQPSPQASLGGAHPPFRAPPSPPRRGEGGIRCSPSFLLRHLGMIPRDQHFAPPVSPSAFLPDFLLSASPCGRIRPFPSPSTPNPAGKRPAEPRHSGFTPEQPHTPVPHCRPAVPPRAWHRHPLKPPRKGNFGGGSRDPGPSPAALTCRHHVRLQVKALPR